MNKPVGTKPNQSKEDKTIPALELNFKEMDLEMEKTSVASPPQHQDDHEKHIAPNLVFEMEKTEITFKEFDPNLSFSNLDLSSVTEENTNKKQSKPELPKEKTITNINLDFGLLKTLGIGDAEETPLISKDLEEDLDSFREASRIHVLPRKDKLQGIEFDVTDSSMIPHQENFNIEKITSIAAEGATKTKSEVEFQFETEVDVLEHAPQVKKVIESPRSELNTAPIIASDINQDIEMQSTLRQIREEREALLKQIKDGKNLIRDLEQDNLSLKAILEETKIEISILRRRHLAEIDDFKYRLSIAEDKKLLAEEKSKALSGQKDKLEQKVRIDIGQVRQREKELETKLELMSIDVDSQVKSRDQKILELRRKIDSLEFNMENVSIKEQKTTEDKRKIEDKLNKVMKTLRNSITNLEDDEDISEYIKTDSQIGKNK
jgi:hypothetical protein